MTRTRLTGQRQGLTGLTPAVTSSTVGTTLSNHTVCYREVVRKRVSPRSKSHCHHSFKNSRPAFSNHRPEQAADAIEVLRQQDHGSLKTRTTVSLFSAMRYIRSCLRIVFQM